MGRNIREEDKRRIIQGFSNSGLSVPVYSRQSGVSETTLYKWQRELRGGDGNNQHKSNSQEFVELGGTKSTYYEIRSGEISLKIPATEAVARIAEIFRSLIAC